MIGFNRSWSGIWCCSPRSHLGVTNVKALKKTSWDVVVLSPITGDELQTNQSCHGYYVVLLYHCGFLEVIQVHFSRLPTHRVFNRMWLWCYPFTPTMSLRACVQRNILQVSGSQYCSAKQTRSWWYVFYDSFVGQQGNILLGKVAKYSNSAFFAQVLWYSCAISFFSSQANYAHGLY